MLRSAGYTVRVCAERRRGIRSRPRRRLRRHPVRYADAGLSGLDVLHKLREHRVDSVFIIMTGVRHHRHGGRGDEARRGRLRAEAVLSRRAADARAGGGGAPAARATGRPAAAPDPRRPAARDAHRGERRHAAGEGADQPRRAAPGARSSSPARREPARSWRRARFMRAARGPNVRSSRSTVPRSPSRCSRTSCSAMAGARSPARQRRGPG